MNTNITSEVSPPTFGEAAASHNHSMLGAVSIDLETDYTSKYSVKSMGIWAYVHDPRFRATQVAAHNDDVSISCTVEEFDWSLFHGVPAVAHNAVFDRMSFIHLQELGVIPPWVQPSGWICTASLSRYFNGPSALDDCAWAWLGMKIDKSLRKRMANAKKTPIDPKELAAYTLKDAVACWKLYKLLIDGWPEQERLLYELTWATGLRGVRLDLAYIEQCRATLLRQVNECKAALPWVQDGSAALSIKAFQARCRRLQIEPPVSTAKEDADLVPWMQAHRDSPALDWLTTMQKMRHKNRTMKVFESMASRVKPDGRMAFELLYCGTSTGRWAGCGGVNVQNFNRESVGDDVDLRASITAELGHRLVICDFAQIEARCLLWLAGDQEAMEVLRSGVDLYEMHARLTMGYVDPRPLKEVDKKLRQLAKARVLGLGYGCGPQRFIDVAKKMGGIDLSFEDSQRIVYEYRDSNPLVLQLWDRLEQAFAKCHGKTYRLPLPSGRRLRYYNVNASTMTAESIKGEPEDWYGGKLTENFVSAVARDILAHAWLTLVQAGYKVVLSVHDELVIECLESESESTKAFCETAMLTPPPWASGLPLAVEAVTTWRYTK